jgi:hypothetical protein
MKNYRLKNLELALIVILILTIIGFLLFGNQEESNLINHGNKIISTIEDFKKENGHFPDSLNEIGIRETEEGPIFYEKRGNSNYVIFFSIGFDETKAYYSDSKKWEDYYR